MRYMSFNISCFIFIILLWVYFYLFTYFGDRQLFQHHLFNRLMFPLNCIYIFNKISVVYISVSLFLGSLFCSIDLGVDLSTNTAWH